MKFESTWSRRKDSVFQSIANFSGDLDFGWDISCAAYSVVDHFKATNPSPIDDSHRSILSSYWIPSEKFK